MSTTPLPPEQEAQAQALVQRLRVESEDELLALARLLVSKAEHELFGHTEFQVRDLVHRLGAKAYEVHLAEKTATAAPASTAPPAGKPPSTRTTAPKRR